MAKNSDKGLYLPLRIDLTAWEQSLTTADADLQKAMREMKASTKDMQMEFDVKIANARAAGNDLKALELENQKLNATFKVQKATVEALNRAYQQSVKEKGEDAKATKALGQQLIYQSKALERTKAQMNAGIIGFGKKFSDELAVAIPTFGKIRAGITGITTALAKVGGSATTAALALGKIGVLAAGLTLTYKGLDKLADSYKETALTAAQANEEVYQLREELNVSYKVAEDLAGAARVDGVNLQSLSSSINVLYKNMDAGNEKGKRAIAWLEEFGAQIKNVDGSRKGPIEFFKELQKALLNAEAVGKGQDLLTNLFGGSGNQYLHFIRGFDYYLEKAKEVQAATEKNYDASHKLLDLKKQEAEAERQLNAVKGDSFVSGATEAQEATIARLQEEIKLYEDAGKKLQGYSDEIRNFAVAQESATLAWNAFLISLKTEGLSVLDKAWKSLKSFSEAYHDFINSSEVAKTAATLNPSPIGQIINALTQGTNSIAAKEKEISSKMLDNKLKDDIKKEEEARKVEERKREQELRSKEQAEKRAAEAEAKVREKFAKELRDATASEYEKQINALNDKKKAYMDEGISEIEANRLFTLQKEQIDRQYFDKVKNEREKQAKQVEENYKREVEAAKQAREAQISEAESTMRSNLKLLRYAEKQRQAGTYNEADIKAYAERLYMKQNGFKNSDFTALKNIGVSKLKDLANARDRLFGQFATVNAPNQQPVTNNNSVTINFDNTILDNVSAMDLLAQKVAAIIDNSLRNAMANNRQGANAYGY